MFVREVLIEEFNKRGLYSLLANLLESSFNHILSIQQRC